MDAFLLLNPLTHPPTHPPLLTYFVLCHQVLLKDKVPDLLQPLRPEVHLYGHLVGGWVE